MKKGVYSVLQDYNKECYVTGAVTGLELHHIYFGSKNKNASDDNGFVVWLTYEKHRGTYGVHGKYGHELDQQLKEECQAAYEALGHTREEFMRLIGKSYIP